MKILVVADVLGQKNNGTTMAAYNLIESLKKRGHEVRVLCGDIDKMNEPGYYVCPLMNFGVFNRYMDKNDVHPAKADEFIISKAMDGVDHVHIMLPFSVGNKAAKMANERGIPITAGFHMQAENLTSHFHLMKLKNLNPTVYRVIYRKMYRYADAIHFPTKFIKDDFEKAVGPTNGYVISNGVRKTFHKKQVERPDYLKDKFVILYTGRYSKEKMQKILIRAVQISKYKDKIQLVLAGDGPMRHKIEKWCEKLPNKPILGIHPQDELIDLINCCDLYVHCAYAELESIACLEALACGLVPVINKTKRVATVNFALSRKNLFQCNNPRSLARRIEYWIEHPEERAKKSKEYEEFTKQFEFEHCMDRMEQMIIEAKKIRDFKTEHHLNNRVISYNSENPLEEDFACTNIDTRKIDGSFVYVHKSKLWRFNAKLLHIFACPLVWLGIKFQRHIKVENRRALKKVKKTGYFLYGNHTSKLDAMIPQAVVVRNRRTYIISNRDSISIKGIRNLSMMMGALPVPDDYASSVNFVNAIEERIKEKGVVAIYPEAHIWPYSTVIRPFGDVSFTYPAKLNVPVVVMVTYYRPRHRKPKPLTRLPRMNIVVSEPFYPDQSLSVKENAEYLRNQVYGFMEKIMKEHPITDYMNYIPCVKDSAKYQK